jgi:hypothetical protein
LRYKKKFAARKRHIPALFEGLRLPAEPEQIALFVYCGGAKRTVGGPRVMFIREFMREVLAKVRTRTVDLAGVYAAATPREVIAYGQDPADPTTYGRVMSHRKGDGAAVGATYQFNYQFAVPAALVVHSAYRSAANP